MEVQVELSKIIINEAVDQQIIVLKELNGDRSFPIVIGMSEAMAIERRSKGIELPRPRAKLKKSSFRIWPTEHFTHFYTSRWTATNWK